MSDNVRELRSVPSIVGPARSGAAVIVEGRIIPRLHCREHGDELHLVLDDRFSISVRKEEAAPVAWMIANALAVGAGYSNIAAETPGRPFAPVAVGIEELPE